MSHNNLIALYCYIEGQMQDIETVLTAPDSSAQQKEFAKGRKKALTDFESFLHAHLDRKLPRRIYRQLKSRGSSCDIRYALGRQG